MSLAAPDLQAEFAALDREMAGSLNFDSLTRKLYATDASVYQELPAAVAFPATEDDIAALIRFAKRHQISLIPRTAGTSLAGQVVGAGIVVDVGKHFTEILSIDVDAKTVVVQPGVVRDELNLELAKYGLMFGPETSTSNRAMIGGMVGNNSCGSNSIVYGTTRDHALEMTGFLSDGSRVTIGPVSNDELAAICRQDDFEGTVYRSLHELLEPAAVRQVIVDCFPKPSIHRRNTGYAVDALMQCAAFEDDSETPFNLCRLIAGSEGTLFFATSIRLQLHPLPPSENSLLCVHFESVDEALLANILVMQHKVYASELIDQLVLQGAARNIAQRENLKFVQGTPGAILVLSLRGNGTADVDFLATAIEKQLRAAGLGYAFPILTGDDIGRIWELRKAGLGVVGNVPGDSKPVAVIEDTAVAIEDLPSYIRDIDQLLVEKYDCQCVYYAHAGSGEIHLRPVLNLKDAADVKKFRDIATDVAALVKTYRGSISGEHGDGRLRSEFIESMVGSECYAVLRNVKSIFDPNHIFNPGKIVDSQPMDSALRYENRPETRQLDTVLDFSSTIGIQRAAEMCTGSGDCRKTSKIGGTMCPSFMATRDERDSTRARANILRHVLAGAGDTPNSADSPLANAEIGAAMDLCLSCKGCKSECPSNVDVGKLKAEFQQAWQDKHGVSRRTKLISNIDRMNRLGAKVPWLANFVASNYLTGWLLKKSAGFATARSLPSIAKQSLRRWFSDHTPHPNAGRVGEVVFFCDEFTNYNEPHIGIAAIEFLEAVGWVVSMPRHAESGRASMSKGLLRKARGFAEQNVELFSEIVSEKKPLIGIEPSAILSFRDEYIDLLRDDLQEKARRLSVNTFTFEEFVAEQAAAKKIVPEHFVSSSDADSGSQQKTIRLHGHCHEKSLVGLVPAIRTLQLLPQHRVRLIPSGCCGMAGSFGYEAEHFDVSMRIGELVLFPTVREEPADHLIVATGTSCRHQIKDGTGRVAVHPAQVLRDALKKPAAQG